MKTIILRASVLSVLFCMLTGFVNFLKFSPYEGELSVSKPYSSIDATLQHEDLAPDFTLNNQAGISISLSQYRDKKNVLLVFYRGSWCPYCVSHLQDIQNLFPVLEKYDVQLLAISKDEAKKSAKLAKKLDKPYVFLSDPDLSATASYGIKNDKDLPNPAVFLIDKSGQIIWYHIDQEYKKRASGLQLKAVMEDVFSGGVT